VSRLARGLVAVLLAVPGAALACSGPGAAAAIERAELGGWRLAAGTLSLVGVATLLARRRGLGRGPVAAGWVLVVVHPGLWLGARGGDCGQTRLEGSVLFACMGAALLLWSLWRPPEAPDADDEGVSRS
jgi:hypothetical protein